MRASRWLCALTLVMAGLSTTPPALATAGPVAQWLFDDDATDAVGSADGVLYGDAAFVADSARGRVLSLDGAGDYVKVATPVSPSAAFTATMWVKRRTAGAGGQVMLQQAGATGRNWLFLEPDNRASAWLGQTTTYGPAALTSTSWYQLAVVHDGTGTVQLYVNGVAGAARTGLSVEASTGDLLIGTNKATTGNFFNGLVDDLRVYDRALTAAEINATQSRAVADVLSGGGYTLTWSDDFDGTSLDGGKWSPSFRSKNTDFIHPGDGFGYFADQVSVSGGDLKITTRAAAGSVNERTVKVKSGSASTAGRAMFTYGYMEARIKVDALGNGYRPAFWLDAVGDADNRRTHSAAYPKSALVPGWGQEVDVLEAYPTYNDFVVHRTDAEVGAESRFGWIQRPGGMALNTYTTVGVLWTPDAYEWFVDGISAGRTPASAGNPVAQTPMYLMLSAAGHSAPGGLATMSVDFVKVYQSQAAASAPAHSWTGVDRGSWIAKASSTDLADGTIAGGRWPARTVKVHGVGAQSYWRSADTQTGDEWFMLDLGRTQVFKQLRIIAPQAVSGDTGSADADGSWAATYDIRLSNDPAAWTSATSPAWSTSAASGTGMATIDACLPAGTSARYVLIRQTGQTPAKKWSIRDVYAYNSAPLTGSTCA